MPPCNNNNKPEINQINNAINKTKKKKKMETIESNVISTLKIIIIIKENLHTDYYSLNENDDINER